MGNGAKVADLGAGGRRLTPTTVTVDFVDCGDTDVIADLHHLPFRDGELDGVVCTGTLEHVEDASRVLAEICRVVRPGGVIHIEVPFLQPFHADPHDYRRWTLSGLRRECAGRFLEELASGVHMGPSVTVAWVVTEYLDLLLPGPLGSAASVSARFLLWPLRFLDRRLIHRPASHRLASGIYYTGLRERG